MRSLRRLDYNTDVRVATADTYIPAYMTEMRQLNKDLKLDEMFGRDGEDVPPFCYFFAATTLNLGPRVRRLSRSSHADLLTQTSTWFHRDHKNVANGYCAVIAGGDYNPRISGHFIMVEPRIVLEFHPGDVIFIMSALITHGNAPILAHETRFSWTWYTAGGLVRWRAAGYRSVKSLVTREEKAAYVVASKEWERRSWSNVLSVQQLLQYHDLA